MTTCLFDIIYQNVGTTEPTPSKFLMICQLPLINFCCLVFIFDFDLDIKLFVSLNNNIQYQ